MGYTFTQLCRPHSITFGIDWYWQEIWGWFHVSPLTQTSLSSAWILSLSLKVSKLLQNMVGIYNLGSFFLGYSIPFNPQIQDFIIKHFSGDICHVLFLRNTIFIVCSIDIAWSTFVLFHVSVFATILSTMLLNMFLSHWLHFGSL